MNRLQRTVTRAPGWLIPALVVLIPTSVGAFLPSPAPDAMRTEGGGHGHVLQQRSGDTTLLPLHPTRTIQFTTRQGTWMSLDVSPDGKSIVFDLLGDLYTLPVTGGRATRITSGPAFDGQPRYSPKGQAIVFTSDRSGSDNLWIIDAEGRNPRPLTNESQSLFVSPEWTPDGDAVVAARSTASIFKRTDLYLYRMGGGPAVQITRSGSPESATSGYTALSETHYLGPAFGPNGRYLYATRGATDATARHQLVRVDRESGESRMLTINFGGAVRPTVSPDGHWLAYGTRRDTLTALLLRDLRTGEEQELLASVDFDHQDWFRWTRDLLPGFAFTPDGSALIVAHHGGIWRIDIPSGRAAQIPFVAEVEQNLGPLARFEHTVGPSVVAVHQIRSPRPSPDGRRLVFSALDRLWTIRLPGGRPRRLTGAEIGEHAPVWSPDGRYIAYVTWSERAGGHIFRIRADGSGQPERLTRSAAFYHKLTYTPDGSRLLAVRESARARIRATNERADHEANGMELISIPARGGEAAVTTELPASGYQLHWFYGTPHFGPDSDRVHIRDPSEGLVSLRLDGTGKKAEVKITEWDGLRLSEQMAQEVLLSPTGTHALALINEQIYLLTLPGDSPGGVSVSVRKLDGAPVPVRRVTRHGGEFPGWQPDGRAFFYSLGSSFFLYDLARADSLLASCIGGGQRSGECAPARVDSLATMRIDIRIDVPRDRASGTIALRGGRVITMRGDEILESGDVLVRDGRIAAVGPWGSVPIPPGARVVDVSGHTVLPALLDIHDHLRTREHIHRTQVWQDGAMLGYGVTTTRDPSTGTSDFLTYSDLIETGALTGPRRLGTGPAVLPSYGINSLQDARDVLRRHAVFYRTGTVKQYVVGNRQQRQWFIMAARELGLTSTAENACDFRMNLTLILDGYPGIEHEFCMFDLYEDVIRLLVESGTINTVTFVGMPVISAEDDFSLRYDLLEDERLGRFYPPEVLRRRALSRTWYHPSLYRYPRIAAQYRKIIAAGGRIGTGAHGNLPGLGTHWNLWALGSGGVPPHDILRAATIWNAAAIGVDKELGSVEPGKLADLVVLDRNPLTDIRNSTSLRFVMKNGRLYDARTLREMWPRTTAPEPVWWERGGLSGR